MKGDFTRRTFRPEKHYSSVRMQQGRVQIDADWNEQVEIQQHLARRQALDFVGQNGVSRATPNAFRIQVDANNEITIGAGRIYVDGILCELDKQVKFTDQPDFPGATVDGNLKRALVYLDVTERHVTALEDPEIVEVALGGADTATRTQIFAQVKLLKLADTDDARFIALEDRFPDARGTPILATVDPGSAPSGNQLYRVEIHDGAKDDGTGATFKWSRDNASAVAEWTKATVTVGNTVEVEVDGLGRVGFAVGQFVELTDDSHELSGQPGVLRKIAKVQGLSGPQTLTLEDPDATKLAALLAEFKDDNQSRKKKARRWDSGIVQVVLKDFKSPTLDFTALPGGGVSAAFQVAPYKTGDAWIIPVRQGGIETVPLKLGIITRQAVLPAEEPHRYAKLAVIARDATTGKLSVVEDLRERFESLTDLKQEINDLRADLAYAVFTPRVAHSHSTAIGVDDMALIQVTGSAPNDESHIIDFFFDPSSPGPVVRILSLTFGEQKLMALPQASMGTFAYTDGTDCYLAVAGQFVNTAAKTVDVACTVFQYNVSPASIKQQYDVFRHPRGANDETLTNLVGYHDAGVHHLFILNPRNEILRVTFPDAPNPPSNGFQLEKVASFPPPQDPSKPMVLETLYEVSGPNQPKTYRLVCFDPTANSLLILRIDEKGNLILQPRLEFSVDGVDRPGVAGYFDGVCHHLFVGRFSFDRSPHREILELWFREERPDRVTQRLIQPNTLLRRISAYGSPRLAQQRLCEKGFTEDMKAGIVQERALPRVGK